MEKEFDDLTPNAKKGLKKVAGASLNELKSLASDYSHKTGRNPYNINNKEHFYLFANKNLNNEGNTLIWVKRKKK